MAVKKSFNLQDLRKNPPTTITTSDDITQEVIPDPEPVAPAQDEQDEADEKKVIVSFSLAPKDKEKLKKYAKSHRCSLSSAVGWLISEYLPD